MAYPTGNDYRLGRLRQTVAGSGDATAESSLGDILWNGGEVSMSDAMLSYIHASEAHSSRYACDNHNSHHNNAWNNVESNDYEEDCNTHGAGANEYFYQVEVSSAFEFTNWNVNHQSMAQQRLLVAHNFETLTANSMTVSHGARFVYDHDSGNSANDYRWCQYRLGSGETSGGDNAAVFSFKYKEYGTGYNSGKNVIGYDEQHNAAFTWDD